MGLVRAQEEVKATLEISYHFGKRLCRSEQNGDRNINISNAPGELSAKQQQNKTQKTNKKIKNNNKRKQNNNKESMFLDPEEKKGNSCQKVTGDFAELLVMFGGEDRKYK